MSPDQRWAYVVAQPALSCSSSIVTLSAQPPSTGIDRMVRRYPVTRGVVGKMLSCGMGPLYNGRQEGLGSRRWVGR